MLARKFDLFPTQILQVKSVGFTPQDIEDAKEDINYVINQKEYLQIDDLTPKWQSHTILFNNNFKWWPGEEKKIIWNKIQESFINACKLYIENCECYKKFKDVQYSGSSAWFFKTDEEMRKSEASPEHDHAPAFLSGVFYLQNPGDPGGNGTTFFSPGPPGYNAGISMPGDELTWVIFPGWLRHQSNFRSCSAIIDRYVIAANIYVQVI